VRNANWMWFEWIGNGTRVGLDDPNPAPDGCLCDAAEPGGAYYKQGDGNVPIHDWALEETLSAIVMQAEQCLQERDVASINGWVYLCRSSAGCRLCAACVSYCGGSHCCG
jgi:hypothetical protein